MTPTSGEFAVTRNKKNKITKLERIKSDGSKIEINPADIFCIVDKGEIYITSSRGFSAAEFKEDDFYFQGRSKVTAKTGNVILASAFFGIIGGLIASDTSAQFVLKIDHLNGAAIQVKQVEK